MQEDCSLQEVRGAGGLQLCGETFHLTTFGMLLSGSGGGSGKQQCRVAEDKMVARR